MRRLSTIIGHNVNTTGFDNQNKNQNNNHFDHPPNQSTSTSTSTPTRPPRPLRIPLQPRERNAMMRLAPKPPLQGGNGNHKINTMPNHDKHPSRPLMPILSAAAQKASGRTPFTPRVAGSVSTRESTPTQPPRLKSQQNKTPGGGRDEVLSPVPSFLSHNITPRSGSRKTRVDSTNTTPNGTPNALSPAPQYGGNEGFRIAQDSTYTGGLGIGGVDRDTQKRPSVSFSPSVSDVGSTKGSVQLKPVESKFFAKDAKAAQTQSARPPFVQQKTSSFLYANGESIPPPPQSSSSSAVGSAIGDERSQPKFFHANGTPDLQASPSPHFAPPRASSTVSSSSRITSPRLANANITGTLSPTPRPASPSKLSQNSVSSASSLRGAPLLPSPMLARSQVLGRGQAANGIVATRRTSIEEKKAAGHGRTTSISSTGGDATRRTSSGSIAEVITPTTPSNMPSITTSLPVLTPDEISDSPQEPPSPTKPSSLEKMNELAANARRERKVLDLEITNSSLAAINRTLEREMRKQTAELRRYRRLSRSGRLSIATSASMRTSTGTLDGELGGLSDMSEEESEVESEIESDSSSSLEGSLSPDAIAESDLRHRQRDEQRLQLDLSKHQQLLVDSQKMNESLKRCLGWTEELISEGKKALAYRVRVSDVGLGGRVLVEDDAEEVDENEGMSDIGGAFLREAREKAAAGKTANGGGSPWMLAREDRDSEIEVDEERITLS